MNGATSAQILLILDNSVDKFCSQVTRNELKMGHLLDRLLLDEVLLCF